MHLLRQILYGRRFTISVWRPERTMLYQLGDDD
jgi:hypothetical protein